MNDAKQKNEILTREELDALLESLASEVGAEGRGQAGAPFRADGPSEDPGERGPYPSVYRAVERFAANQTRNLSNVYQSRIEYRIVDWKEMTLGEAADRLLDSDRVALFEAEPHAALGFVWLSRPLLFAFLCLSFGARPGGVRSTIPERSYTGIERRVYKRLAEETLEGLEDCFKALTETRIRLLSIDASARLRADAHDWVIAATVDVRGLGDVCRMRIGLPRAPFEALRAPIRTMQPGRRAALARAVTEMRMRLRVELGSLEMSLSELAALRKGSVIPIQAAEDGCLLVRIGGRPKFRAIRGSVGQKVAVQLTERLERLQEVSDG